MFSNPKNYIITLSRLIQDRQNFWKHEINQQLSKYKHLCSEVNKMLKAVDVPQTIQRKLPAKLETLLEMMEDKILDTNRTFQDISKEDLEFINLNYQKVNDYVTSGYNQLIDFLSKNGMLKMSPSKETKKQQK